LFYDFSYLQFSHEPGKELNLPHQMGLAGAVSLPVFWLAGAGAAVFWVLGKQIHISSSCCGLSLLWACKYLKSPDVFLQRYNCCLTFSFVSIYAGNGNDIIPIPMLLIFFAPGNIQIVK